MRTHIIVAAVWLVLRTLSIQAVADSYYVSYTGQPSVAFSTVHLLVRTSKAARWPKYPIAIRPKQALPIPPPVQV